MGTILASAIIADASATLQDASNTRWTLVQMLSWLNAGQREIVSLSPSSNVKNVVMPLVAGTKQTLPTGAILLLDVIRNMGADTLTPGRVPRFIHRDVIDTQNPNWHTDAASPTVMQYVYDNRDQAHFYVHPKQPTTAPGSLEIIHSANPTVIAATSNVITLDDVYANALTSYVLYRAYSKDPASAAKAGDYYKAFILVVAGKDAVDSKDKAKASEPEA